MRFSSSETAYAPLTAGQVLDLGALTLRSRREGAAHVLALFGELDVASAGEVEEELRRAEDALPAAAAIVVDLRGLIFIDSTGLRLLIEASNRAEESGHRLRLVRPRPRVFRVCEIAGVDALLPFENAPPEADA